TAAQDALRAQQDRIADQSAKLGRLRARFRDLAKDARRAVREAAVARRELADHAVTAYMVGPLDEQLALVRSADVVDMGVARSYLDVVLGTREKLLRRYDETRRGLDRDQQELAEGLGELQSE